MLKIINLYEHFKHTEEELKVEAGIFFQKNKEKPVFQYQNKVDNGKNICVLEANYYVGLDRISSNHCIFVAPKVNRKLWEQFDKSLEENDENKQLDEIKTEEIASNLPELDIVKMLSEVVALPNASKEISKLLYIDWDSPEIEIEQHRNDYLSPFLMIQFLQLMKTIVRKGLKKSYYTIEETLNSRIKGKIIISKTTKQQIFKNKKTDTVCKYQEFGYNSLENRFLKKVLEFVKQYISNNNQLFSSTNTEIQHNIAYISSAYQSIIPLDDIREIKNIRHNKFYKEYQEAIQIGEFILKRFSYSITNSVQQQQKTPPYWIDMPLLFELYVYKNLLEDKRFKDIKYHLTTYGNELDFIGFYKNSEEKEFTSVVIDAKYKLYYDNHKNHQDIRQVSGYSRLEKVYKNFSINEDKIIDCLIVFPTTENKKHEEILPIKAYRKVYKTGINLPKFDLEKYLNNNLI